MIFLDSNFRKIVGKRNYLIIDGGLLENFKYDDDVPLIKNKGLYFYPSRIKDISIRKMKISMSGYVGFYKKKRVNSIYGSGLSDVDGILQLNAICLKSPTQKRVDFFEYENIQNFHILFIDDNVKEFAKMKLLQLDTVDL